MKIEVLMGRFLTGQIVLMNAPAPAVGFEPFSSGIFPTNFSGPAENLPLHPFQQKPINFPW